MKLKFVLAFFALWFIAAYGLADNKAVTADKSGGDREGEYIDWQVLSTGGNYSTNPIYQLYGTTNQISNISMESSEYCLGTGFWGGLYGTCSGGTCCDTPGDANDDINVNILDITYLIAYLYQSGPPPPCLYEGDAGGDCTINILDITYLIAYLYQSGPGPICSEICPGW